MNSEEKILEMLGAMQTQITAMQTDMKAMQTDMKAMHQKIDDLTESQAETRENINAILEWTDKISSAVNFPLPRI